MGPTCPAWTWTRPRKACRRPGAGACSVFLHHHRDGGGSGRDVARVGAVVEWRGVARVLLRLIDELGMLFDKAGAQLASAEVRALQDRAVVVDRRRRTNHNE